MDGSRRYRDAGCDVSAKVRVKVGLHGKVRNMERTKVPRSASETEARSLLVAFVATSSKQQSLSMRAHFASECFTELAVL